MVKTQRFIKKIPFLVGSFLLISSSALADWTSPFLLHQADTIRSPAIDINSTAVGAFIVSDISNSQLFEFTGVVRPNLVFSQNAYSSLEGSLLQSNQTLSLSEFNYGVTAWIETNALSQNLIRAALFLSGRWQDPITLTNPSLSLAASGQTPGVNMTENQEALVVWVDYVPGSIEYQIQWNLYTSGSWINPSTFLYQSSNFLGSFQFSGNLQGAGLATWIDYDEDIAQATFYDGSSWTNNTSVATDVASQCSVPLSVSLNASGQGLIFYANNAASISSVFFDNGTYSSSINAAPDLSTFILDAAVSYSNANLGIGMWITYESESSTYKLYAKRFMNGNWEATNTLLDSISGVNFAQISDPSVAIDNFDNAILVWRKVDDEGNSGIYYATYTSTTESWNAVSTPLSTNTSSQSPALALNGAGAALVAWSTTAPEPQRAEAVFSSSGLFAPEPAQSLTGRQVKNTLPMQSEYVNLIQWNKSPSPDVTSYYLYRDSKQIATVSSSSPLSYQDNNRKKGTRYLYSVRAVTFQGNISSAISITVP